MSTQKYNVNHQIIDSLLGWVKSGEIAIPEIQRPFVWTPVKVRNLMDSLYQKFPINQKHFTNVNVVRLLDRLAAHRELQVVKAKSIDWCLFRRGEM
jgi:hypothetical protein